MIVVMLRGEGAVVVVEVVMVGGEGVDEGAVVVVEITASPGGEEVGDGGHIGTLVGEMILYTVTK